MSITTDLNIAEILRGMEPGRLQTVGVMQVLPLRGDSDLYDEDIISPADEEKRTLMSTNDYGSMDFDNPTDKVLLVPCHVGYVTSQKAQDHAMSHTGMVGKNARKRFNSAMCIQQTQGGYINAGQHKMMILPHALRESALDKRHRSEYGKLWSEISKFNMSMGVKGGGNGHLEYFLKEFEKELDEFVAEFECVSKQCGAIILINGQVVGVERAPNPRFWRDIWEPLIRECYGSLAIQAAKKTSAKSVLKTRVPLTGSFNSLDDLEAAIDETEEKQTSKAKEIVRKLLNDSFKVTVESGSPLKKYKIITVKNDQFTGQVVQDDSKICYASLFTTKEWAKSAPWRKASRFTI